MGAIRTAEREISVDPGAEALDGWSAFPVARRPRPIVLIGAMLRESGYATGDAKLAVATGRLELHAPLPQIPSRLPVRLPGGTVELPTVSARTAFVVACAAGSPANAPDADPPPLRITKVALGTARFWTDRGPWSLPAWLFRAPGALAPLATPALHPSAFWRPGELQHTPVDWGELTVDGRLLTVTVPAPEQPADTFVRYVPVVAESATAVLIELRMELDTVPDSGLVDDLTLPYTVRLSSPLGNRVAIDCDGHPLPVMPA